VNVSTQNRRALEAMVKQSMDEGWIDQNPDQILVNMQDDLAQMYIAAGAVRAGEDVDWEAQVEHFLQERKQQLTKMLCDPKKPGLQPRFKKLLGKDDLSGLLNNLAVTLLPIVVFNQEVEIAKYFPLTVKLAFYVVRVGLDKWCTDCKAA